MISYCGSFLWLGICVCGFVVLAKDGFSDFALGVPEIRGVHAPPEIFDFELSETCLSPL